MAREREVIIEDCDGETTVLVETGRYDGDEPIYDVPLRDQYNQRDSY